MGFKWSQQLWTVQPDKTKIKSAYLEHTWDSYTNQRRNLLLQLELELEQLESDIVHADNVQCQQKDSSPLWYEAQTFNSQGDKVTKIEQSDRNEMGWNGQSENFSE